MTNYLTTKNRLLEKMKEKRYGYSGIIPLDFE